MKFPLEACKQFLEQQFGQDLVFPIYQWIVPCPKNRAQLIEWVDRWVDDPNSFVDPIGSWDVIRISDFSSVLAAYRNPQLVDFDEELNWDMSNATTMAYMFSGCRTFTGRGLKLWKVSNVTNMFRLFANCAMFIGDVSEWDTSNVTKMDSLFCGCELFDGDVSQWRVHNVTTMSGMFMYCKVFDGDVSGWDVSNVTMMWKMFDECHALDASLEKWDVSSVQNVRHMLGECKSFNRDSISLWNLPNDVNGVEVMFTSF